MIKIKNTNFYETTEGVEFKWAAHGDRCELGCGILSLPVIEPQSSYDIEWKSGPWYPLWASSDAEEIFLTITAKLLHSKRWVEAGHVVSSIQVQLPAKRDIVPHFKSFRVTSAPFHTQFLSVFPKSEAMSVIGEAALAAFFDALFSKLAELLDVVTEKQVREELHKWERILASIQAVLDDAEEKHVKNRHVKRWPKRAIERPPTTSLVTETEVYGRANDKDAIFELISNRNVAEICVIPIVGMGGIGKTTLAKLVYNDTRVNNYFDLKAWVCISEIFDIMDITKSILREVGSEHNIDQYSLNKLQTELKEKLSGKKLLLILDDLWHQNPNDWADLLAPFGEGTTIIVTTRDQSVSSMTRTVRADHTLQKLSDEDCLSVLTHRALGAKDFTRHPNLEEIGRKIVKKCNGLPLAVKTIGGLLRNKVDLDAWKDIQESETWNLPEERSNIIPALRISYHHLPPCLKRCFAYCAILPKDYEFTEMEIVWLWMAEGFLQVEAVKQNEDLGKEIFQELVSRSFFEISSHDKSRYVMHDLINDLAQSITKEICFRVEGDKILNISKHARHSSYIGGWRDGIKKFQVFYGTEHLRTFLPLKLPNKGGCYISNQVLSDLLPKLKCLRVLSLEGYHLTELPDVFGDLIHLRYLNFSYTRIKTLPDSICKLCNLETLILRMCHNLEEFPSRMRDLINLRHLDFTGLEVAEACASNRSKQTGLERR
ncbi:putative disease resistance RPP13-like protein 1 [Herrania umbratica]|uniref:Disease resistance RPP13-like protein 1 n=1 Tax=Herrania umbratica TaxID=108875 RepID=A0A6J1BD61_9ROSI|nr:putative disease resistance RPP13-like protein 1 [Herrania umbratica]